MAPLADNHKKDTICSFFEMTFYAKIGATI